MRDSFVVGEIDRISGIGNAMLEVDSGQYNLGPLPDETVGKFAIAVPVSGIWAVCLTPHINCEQYLTEFLTTSNISRKQVEKAIENADAVIDDYSDVELPDPSLKELTEGMFLESHIVVSGPEASYAMYADGTVVEIDTPYLPSGYETTVEIVDTTVVVPKAKIAESVFADTPRLGTELMVEITATKGSTAYGVADEFPIVLPQCTASEGETVRTGVHSILPGSIEAMITSLPERKQTNVGDSFELEFEFPRNGPAQLVHDGIPLQIPSPDVPIDGNVPLTVTKVEANTIIAEVDFRVASGVDLSIGQTLPIDGIEQRGDRLVGDHEGMPVAIPITHELFQVPTSLEVLVTEIAPSEVSATISGHPRIDSLCEGAMVTVSIDADCGDYLSGTYQGFPVWVPYDESVVPSDLTVNITHIAAFGIFASPAPLPGDVVSEHDMIVPAQIDETDSSAATAWIPETTPDPFAVPVLLLVNANFRGEVGVELVDQDKGCFVGILRTTETGDEAMSVSSYLLHTQRAVMALRTNEPTEAASAWEAASEVTNSTLREIESKRSATYAQAEASLRDEAFDAAKSTIGEFRESVTMSDVPDNYHDALQNEMDVYFHLITVSQKKAPDSVSGLQRIAHNISIRPRLNQAANLLSQWKAPIINEWQPIMPHPYIEERLRRLTAEFDSIPEAVTDVLDCTQELEETRWSIPPAMDDPRPTGAFEIPPIKSVFSVARTPEATDRHSVNDDLATDIPSDEGTPAAENHSPTVTEFTTNSSVLSSGEDAPTDNTVEPVPVDSDTSDTSDRQSEEPNEAEQTGNNTDQSEIADAEPLVVNRNTPTDNERRDLRELRRKAEAVASDNPVRDTSESGTTSRYRRASEIKTYVKARANGICEACGEPAPFETPDGDPYLEAHHVDELGAGGKDHPAKVVAVCPICHKRIHYGRDGDRLNRELREKLANGLAQVGQK